MKKLLIKTLILCAISVSVLNFVFDPIFRDSSANSKTFGDYCSLSEDEVDIFILGSSHGKNAYNPSIIDSLLGTSTFNLGSGGQNLISTSLLLREVLDSHNPKLIIIDLYPTLMKIPSLPEPKASQLRVIDYTGLNLAKLKTIGEIFSYKEIPSVFSETIRNHDTWYNANWSLSEFEINNDNWIYHRGYFNTYSTMEEHNVRKYQDFIARYEKFGKVFLSKGEIEKFRDETKYLQDVIEICKNKNIPIAIVSAPYFDSFYNNSSNKMHQYLKGFLNEQNVTYIDFNNYFNELGLTLDDFWDKGHLNVKGSEKVSVKLAEKISELKSFEIIDRRLLKIKKAKITPRDPNLINELVFEERASILMDIINKGKKVDIEHNLTDSIRISSLSFLQTEKKNYLAIKTEKPANLEQFYFLVSKTVYEEDYDKRPKWQLNTANNKLHWEIAPETIEIQGDNYILLGMNKKGELDKFKSVRVVLKNKSDKKTIGKPLVVNDIQIN